MRTTAKARALAQRRMTLRRRQHASDVVGAAVGRARWHEVLTVVEETGDPQATELAGVVAVLMGQLVERVAELRADCLDGASA